MNLLEEACAGWQELAIRLAAYLDCRQGLRIGESSVVSRFEHLAKSGWRGTVIVLSNAEPEQHLNIDVFHDLVELPDAAENAELQQRLAGLLLAKFSVEGIIHCQLRRFRTRIRISLAMREWQYPVIVFVIAEVEDYLASHGVGLRKVEQLLHLKAADRTSVLQVAVQLGAVEAALGLLKALDPRQSQRPTLSELSAKHGGMSMLINSLISEGIVKRTLWGGYELTAEGEDLLDNFSVQGPEFEAEYRKLIRSRERNLAHKRSVTPHKSAVETEISDRGRISRIEPGEWIGNLAIAETVLAAKVGSIRRGKQNLEITRNDLHAYRRFRKVPQDILVLIDASTSMRGKRFRAAMRLAEHLVLTTRERVGVITFQNTTASVVCNFTRNHSVVQKGLQQVQPGGLTPMAGAFAEAERLIQEARAKNPLVILISDGLPTVALETSDPVRDAITAAGLLPQLKARFLVIGIKPNAEFLNRLATAANGSAYIVDDLAHDTLITIVREKNIGSIK